MLIIYYVLMRTNITIFRDDYLRCFFFGKNKSFSRNFLKAHNRLDCLDNFFFKLSLLDSFPPCNKEFFIYAE